MFKILYDKFWTQFIDDIEMITGGEYIVLWAQHSKCFIPPQQSDTEVLDDKRYYIYHL